jgi:hypothetical protein
MPTIPLGGLIIQYAHFIRGVSGVWGIEPYPRYSIGEVGTSEGFVLAALAIQGNEHL